MALKYYVDYIDNLAMSPNTEYRSGMQALVDAQWDNTTTKYTIQEEANIGTFIYTDIEVYINHVINESSTGRKNGDDFRKLIFKEIIQSGQKSFRNARGHMYKFDNNYWITTFTDNYNGDSVSVVVRRCNNIAKYVDKETGDIIEVPCVLDYTATSPSPKYSEDIVTPDNHVVLIVQGNNNTKWWKQNQRFIFNGRPFKITGFNNYLQNNYVTQDTTILYFDLYLDEIQPGDDIENSIANRYDYVYSVNILQGNFSAKKGDSGTLTAEVRLNNEVVNRSIIWSCIPSTGANIDSEGNYIILAEPGTEVEFKASISQYDQVTGVVTCQVVESLPEIKKLVIDPVLSSIPQGQSKTFSVNLYIDGIKQTDIVNYSVEGVSTSYYSLKRNGNDFTVSALRASTNPLVFNFSVGDIKETLEIKLKSAF